jgi:hypothetical protein
MKRIGRSAFGLFFFCGSLFSAPPFFRLCMPSGEIVSHVAAQQPVVLEIVSDQPLHMPPPPSGIAQFVNNTSHASSYTKNNGVASHEYRYRWHCTFPQPQVIAVGPLVVSTDSGVYTISPISITVVPPHDHAPRASAEYDRRSLVVGEWGRGEFIFVVPAQAPCGDFSCPVPDGLSLRTGQPQRSRIALSGKAMDEIRYPVEWMAKLPGSYTLGPPSLQYGSVSGGAFGFLSRFVHEQSVLSGETIRVVVEPLPPYDGPVHAVGDIQKVFMRVGNDACVLGTALSLDFCIIGPCTLRADLNEFIPSTDAYSIYYAHHEQVPNAVRGVYTLKPERVGLIICEPPPFTFFNTRTGAYETIRVQPLTLAVSAPARPRDADESETVAGSCDTDSSDLPQRLSLVKIFFFLCVVLIVCSAIFCFLRPIRILYAIRSSSDSDTCALYYGFLCMMLSNESDPSCAVKKLSATDAAPLGSEIARWYLEQRYVDPIGWKNCRIAVYW